MLKFNLLNQLHVNSFVIDSNQLVGAYLGGLVVVSILYFFTRKKGVTSTSVPIQEVIADFWFNHFLVRKIASFIYFISLSSVVGTIFLSAVVEGEGSQGLIWIGLSVLCLAITRVLLELIIAVVKIAENTSLIAGKS